MKNEINNKLIDLGFALTSSVPRPGISGGRPVIVFDTTIYFRGKEVLKSEYKFGVGNVDPIGPCHVFLLEDEQALLQTWRRNKAASFRDPCLHARVAAKLAVAQKLNPTIADVLHALLMDGRAFFEAQSFQEWADELGYSTDSISALETYRLCDGIGRQLASKTPADVLSVAKEIIRDL